MYRWSDAGEAGEENFFSQDLVGESGAMA